MDLFEKPLADCYRETISRQRLDELIRLFAKSYVAHLKSMRMAEAILASTTMANVKKIRTDYIQAAMEAIVGFEAVSEMVMKHVDELPAKVRSETAKTGGDKANEKHRKLQEAIRASWATGNFQSRDVCAEQEYSGLGFGSLKAARNALINKEGLVPDPDPWPAKKQSKK